MNREHIQLLIDRATDGAASAAEREELSRALKSDPLLRAEFDENETTHAATSSLFRQLALPEDFSKRVMRRIQGSDVPADEGLENLRLPSQRPLGARAVRVVAMQRKRARIYAIVAAVSAAAALILAFGVLTGAFNRASTAAPTTDEKSVADGLRGVPDRGGLNRTEPPTPQPLPTEGPEAPKGDPRPDPEKGDTGDTIEKPPARGEVPEPAPVVPEPKPEDVVETPDEPEAEPEVQPDDVVDDGAKPVPEPDKVEPAPDKKDGSTVATTREKLGRLQLLNGRVDVVGADGSLTRLENDAEIYSGDRLRTRQNYNTVALLQLEGGDVTLGKETQVTLEGENTVILEPFDNKEKGVIAVDRGAGHSGSSFEVRCSDYALYVLNGTSVLERRKQGLRVSKAIGFSTLTHEVFGSVLFSEESGFEADVDFGKDFQPPKARAQQLPAWSAETRARAVMLALETSLTGRTFAKANERAYVNTNMQKKLEKLMLYPTTTDTIVEFLSTAIARPEFDGVSLVKMAAEVEMAYAEVSELSPQVIAGHAKRAAMVGENFEQWRDYFYRLMRPPVEPKNPPPQPVPQGDTDCPLEKDKLKRVDDPPPKKTVKPVPPNNGESPKDPKEEEKTPN